MIRSKIHRLAKYGYCCIDNVIVLFLNIKGDHSGDTKIIKKTYSHIYAEPFPSLPIIC